MIGQRVKIARSAAGLSLRQLEAKIDNLVTAQAISKYERDESMPSSKVLIALADALDVSPEYLISDRDIQLEGIEFRKKKPVTRREETRVEARVLDMLERYLTVEEILHLPSVDWDKPREAPWPVRAGPAEAEHAANGLRAHWGLGTDPIPNLVELLEERGIKVLSMSLGNIDGLTARVRRENGTTLAVIVVNSKEWGERQRFTMAMSSATWCSMSIQRLTKRRLRTDSQERFSCQPIRYGWRSASDANPWAGANSST